MQVLTAALLLFAIAPGYQDEVAKWRQQREAKLKAEDGWLSVSGLFWLKDGYNRIGTSPTSTVRIPRGPANAAILTRRAGFVHLEVNPGVVMSVNGRLAEARVRRNPWS